MNGGERKCQMCVHGPSQEACDVYAEANRSFTWLPYGGMYCRFMEYKPSITARVATTAKRFASQWPSRKKMDE